MRYTNSIYGYVGQPGASNYLAYRQPSLDR